MRILVFILGILIGYTFGEVLASITDRWKRWVIIKNYHLHHSLIAIPLFIIALFTEKIITDVLLGLSAGIIIQHTYKEGLIFVTKK